MTATPTAALALGQQPEQERAFVGSALPRTMELILQFKELFQTEMQRLPYGWPREDKFFAVLLPSFEAHVRAFHEEKAAPALIEMMPPHKVSEIDGDIVSPLKLLLLFARERRAREKTPDLGVSPDAYAQLECVECSQPMNSNRALLQHLRTEHGETPQQYFKRYADAGKFCSKCKNVLPATHFLRDRSNNYGLRAQCIHCMRGSAAPRIACPICNRVVQHQAITHHMWTEHLIHPEDAYKIHLKEKYCPHCGRFLPLADFYEVSHPAHVCQPWCKSCSRHRDQPVMEEMIRDACGEVADLSLDTLNQVVRSLFDEDGERTGEQAECTVPLEGAPSAPPSVR